MGDRYMINHSVDEGQESDWITFQTMPGLDELPWAASVARRNSGDRAKVGIRFEDADGVVMQEVNYYGRGEFSSAVPNLTSFRAPFKVKTKALIGDQLTTTRADDQLVIADPPGVIQPRRWVHVATCTLSSIKSCFATTVGGARILIAGHSKDVHSFNGTTVGLATSLPAADPRVRVGTFLNRGGLVYMVGCCGVGDPDARLYSWNGLAPEVTPEGNPIIVDSPQCRMMATFNNEQLLGPVLSAEGLKPILRYDGGGTFTQRLQAFCGGTGSWFYAPVIHNGELYWYEPHADRLHRWDGSAAETSYEDPAWGEINAFSMASFNGNLDIFGPKWKRWNPVSKQFDKVVLASGYDFASQADQQHDCYSPVYWGKLYTADQRGRVYRYRTNGQISFMGHLKEAPVGLAMLGPYLYAVTESGKIFRQPFKFQDIFA
jgi:hypothetical protein